MGTLNKTSERFTNAVTKLYNAFHSNKLEPFNCYACAVGSIVGDGNWFLELWQTCSEGKHYIKQLKFTNIKFKDLVYDTGYSVKELMKVEEVFLKQFESRSYEKNKQSQFTGLCAVVEYLCELEGIPNVMDYTCLFETENNEPKYKLENVLS